MKLLDYLKQVFQLELDLYQMNSVLGAWNTAWQGQCKHSADMEQKLSDFKHGSARAPQGEEFEQWQYRESPTLEDCGYISTAKKKKTVILCIAGLILSVIGFLVYIISFSMATAAAVAAEVEAEPPMAGVAIGSFGFIGLIAFGIALKKNSRKLKEMQDVNHHAVQTYDRLCDEISAHNEGLEAHNAQAKKACEAYYASQSKKRANAIEAQKKTCEEAKAYAKQMGAMVSTLQSTIAATQGILEKIYAADIIYPKYRNLVAVGMFCEYLMSGRCEKLEGHEGAYNIFENELRQNMIVSKLDDVTGRLDELKGNMHFLATSLERGFSSMQGMMSLNAANHARSTAALEQKIGTLQSQNSLLANQLEKGLLLKIDVD